MRPTFRVFAAALACLLAGLASTPQRPADDSQRGNDAPHAAASNLSSPAERLAADEKAFQSAATPVEHLVALYRIEEISPLLPPAAMSAALDALGATPDLGPLLEAEIESQEAAEDLRAGDAAAAAAIWHKLGEVESWKAVGPFDNSSPSAIEKQEGPEKALLQAADLKTYYAGKQRQVGWREMPYTATLGEVQLSAYLSPTQSASAYLVSWVRSPEAQAVALRLRDSGASRVWVNGALVFDEQGAHASDGFDQHAAGARLASGWNQILAKVGDTESADWRFSLRVTTPAGAPLTLEATAIPPADAATATSGASAPPTVSDLTAMAKAAASGSGAGELNYAWVLSHKHNFNAGDHSSANAFIAAIAALPGDQQAVLDFAEHDNDQSRIYQNLEELLGPDGSQASAATDAIALRAHLLRGMIEIGRNEYWPARQDFAAALGQPDNITALAPTAALARAPMAGLGMLDTYAGMGVRPQVLAWAAALKAAGEQSTAVAAPTAAVLLRMGAVQEALNWYASAHASDAGNLGISLQLSDAQRRTGDFTDALATLRQAATLNGALPMLEEAQARGLSGMGRGPEALAAIRQAVELAPDTPSLRIAQGEIERHFGHATEAVEAWQTALSLNPQDSDLRDRLRLVQGSEAAVEASFERPYTQDLNKAIANYKAQANPGLESGPVVVLADTNVTNIFPSGNTGRYVQQIFRVNNSNGADSLAVYSVTYDPATEEVRFLSAHVVHPDGTSADAPEAGDQPISQSVGYETFYNVRNKFVEMPSMRPGDFVEIAYRVVPTTLESLYGDYYGDLDAFGSSAPTLFQQYVVITPENMNLYFKAIRFTGAAEEHTANGQKVYRWSARDLPAQVSEPSAPPMIEQAPYIAVSAFQTWDQFGRWYTQLIRDTFVMDDEMTQTVQALVKGKTSEEEKADAIYRWVIQNTHYVALEFGIHGYRPYPVTQVFHRRFGDCKDKASLLIAMLHAAGIESEFVLVRVRELGVIDPTIPAVADFDHAIVYVPGLHRYLDGTAEYNGADELPEGDQRAFVLRIPVDGDLAADSGTTPGADVAVSTRAMTAAPAASAPLAPQVTPEQPATANVESRVLNGEIDASGNLRFQMSWILSGGRAPEFRQALELPDRQAGALQAMLHDRLPGITVTDAEVKNDDNWDQPIEISLEGTIPRFATVNGNTLLVPRQILTNTWLPQMASLAQRQYDVLIGPPTILQEEMHLALPAGYQPALPPTSQMTQPFATFQADATLNGGTLTLRSRVETKQSLIPPATYPAFRTFWSQVDAALGRAVALTPAKTAAGGRP